MEEISLQICNETFLINKEVLCEHSDYFRAMFSGNYVENQKKKVIIDMLDPNTMNIIFQYMKIGLIDLSEYSLSTIGSLGVAANFLQVTELIKQIEYTLDIQTNASNWMEIMTIAENCSLLKLERLCAAYGLFSFKSMKPEYVPTIHKLAWYLSHPYLDTQSELDVFGFGVDWITHKEIGADALLIILGCLDMKGITKHNLKEMKNVMKDYENSLAAKVVGLLYDLSTSGYSVTENNLLEQKTELCQKFTERVWSETLNIVKNSKSRCLQYTPVVPVWVLNDSKQQVLPHCMYTFNEDKGFEKWLEVAEENLWGWSVVSWGLTKLVVVGGEHGRGTGIFMRDVKVYDTLRKEWTRHGVQLPQRRHAGLVVVGDTLYMVGGVGGFRIVLETAIAYDLKQRTYRKLARFPDAIQNPAACSHKEAVYIAGEKNIYRYEDSGTTDCWRKVAFAEMKMSCIRSFKDYIYCTQFYFTNLYRFRPDIDEKMEVITCFSNLPASVCHLGHKLYVFTWMLCDQSMLTVEEVTGEKDETPKILFTKANATMRVNDVAGSCSLVLSLPPLCMDLSQYHKRYLKRYIDLV